MLKGIIIEGAGSIPAKDVKWQWINHFFDGPVEGVALYKDLYCYCIMTEESKSVSETSWYRKYVLLELTSEQTVEEIYWHEEFCKYVGDHFKCNEDSSRIKVGISNPKSQIEMDKFYIPYQEKYSPSFTKNTVLGIFTI